MFEERHTFLAALDQLPSTFCHLDAWRKNLLSRRVSDGTEQTVGVDWAFSGIGAIGVDLAPLVAFDSIFFLSDPDKLPALDRAAFAGYVAGLRDTGWVGDERLPRLGYILALSLRYGCSPIWFCADDPALRTGIGETRGHSYPDLLDRYARVTRFVCDLADEARGLMTNTDYQRVSA